MVSTNIAKSTDKTTEKIHKFSNLKLGWFYGDGGPPPQSVVDLALKLNAVARENNFETDVFPGTDELQLTVYDGDFTLEFSLYASGKIGFCLENEADLQKEFEILDITVHEASEKIIKFRELQVQRAV